MSDWPSRLARGRLTQAPLLRFVRRLGNIVDEAGMPQALHCRTGLEWHSDGSRALTMLSCAEAPSAGGETLFASSSQSIARLQLGGVDPQTVTRFQETVLRAIVSDDAPAR